MAASSFQVTNDAAGWIVAKIQAAKNSGEFMNLAPCLIFCFDYQMKDKEGRCIECFTNGFFDIGWYPLEIAIAQDFAQVEIGGLKIWLPLAAWERLDKMELVLDEVEVGYPTPSRVRKSLLRAFPTKVYN